MPLSKQKTNEMKEKRKIVEEGLKSSPPKTYKEIMENTKIKDYKPISANTIAKIQKELQSRDQLIHEIEMFFTTHKDQLDFMWIQAQYSAIKTMEELIRLRNDIIAIENSTN